MPQQRSVTVYCSSSQHVSPIYFDAAAELGRAIAAANWTLVYGGNAIGPMGRMADAARAAGGKVVGITPQVLVDEGIADTRCDELVITESMRHRKELLERRGDAFIALPGGLGTLEELFEIIVSRQLKMHDKPIVIVNIDDFYRPLLDLIDHWADRKFIRARVRELFIAPSGVGEAVQYLQERFKKV